MFFTQKRTIMIINQWKLFFFDRDEVVDTETSKIIVTIVLGII